MLATLMLASAVVQTVDYRVSVATVETVIPMSGSAAIKPGVMVTMTFTGDTDGETAIELPTQWAGSDELWRSLGQPAVEGGALVASGRPDRWAVRHRPGARITIRYTVGDGQPGAPDAATFEKARPVIEPGWLSIHGQGAIAVPHGRERAPARLTLVAPPSGWRMVSDLTGSGRPLTVNDVGEGVIVGGTDLRLATRTVGGRTLRVAVVGRWPFPDAALADPVARLMATENAALGAPAANYLVTLVPLTGSNKGAISYGGTGGAAGFALEATDNVPPGDFARVLAHEYAHRWFGRGFGPSADSAHDYLFSEGFNDWFAARAMVASGLWTPREWADQLDTVLLRYGASTARGLSEAEITEKFWTDGDAQQLQYDRGNLTALRLDARLRAAGRPGLIALLRAMPGEAGDERARIERLADRALPGAFAAAVRDAADALPADALAACGALAWVEQPAYGRGFDIDDARRVTRVEPGSGAERAGIKPGMAYERRLSFKYLDASVPYVAEFTDGGAKRTVTWLPALVRNVRFQKLTPTAVDTPACRAAIAGAPVSP